MSEKRKPTVEDLDPIMRQYPFIRPGMSEEEYYAEKEYYIRQPVEAIKNQTYKPLWKQNMLGWRSMHAAFDDDLLHTFWQNAYLIRPVTEYWMGKYGDIVREVLKSGDDEAKQIEEVLRRISKDESNKVAAEAVRMIENNPELKEKCLEEWREKS